MRKPVEPASAVGAAALAILCAACTAAGTGSAPQHDGSVPSRTATASADPIDFAASDRLVGDARFVIFGEDSHRMPAVQQLVNAMFRHLVEQQGFRTFVFESYWGIEEAVNGFLASDRAAPNDEEAHFLNAFASQPIVELLLWARAYNRAHPRDPVRFTGYHPDQPVTDATALRAFGEQAPALETSSVEAALTACGLEAGKYANDVALLTALSVRRQSKQPAYTQAARAACGQGLNALGEAIDRQRATLERQASRAAVEEAELHIAGLRFFVQESSPAGDTIAAKWLGGPSTDQPDPEVADLYQKADKMRFEIFETLQETRPRTGKTFLWMHNWHAARNSQTIDVVHNGQRGRAVSIGERLSRRYGDKLVIIGNIVPCVSCGEPAGSLEPAFATHFGQRTGVVDFSDEKSSAGLPIRTPGILFAQYHKPITASIENMVLDEHFDGVIYLPNAETLPRSPRE
ncbi:MAG: erythromycin esterase family protein [Steroidobacteraceae bacterium]